VIWQIGPMKHFLFALLALISCPLSAQDSAGTAAGPRSITVTGNAERVLPADHVRISGSLRSVRDELAAARIASQEGFATLVQGLGKLGVSSDKIELENHTLGREYENGPNDERIAKGFFSARQFTIALDDASLLELVHGSLAEITEITIDGTIFSRSDEIEVRKELRKSALSAALEKAGAMASVYGEKVGRPLKISEGSSFGPAQFSTRNLLSMPVFGEAGGRVTLNAFVEVTFELVD
jgi:uncharacterized protein